MNHGWREGGEQGHPGTRDWLGFQGAASREGVSQLPPSCSGVRLGREGGGGLCAGLKDGGGMAGLCWHLVL